MAAPWIEYFSQIQALFENDPEIKIIINYDDNLVKLYVDNSDKAAAIEKLIPKEKVFGNVTARVIVIPANQEEKSRAEQTPREEYRLSRAGNILCLTV